MKVETLKFATTAASCVRNNLGKFCRNILNCTENCVCSRRCFSLLQTVY